MEFSGLNCREEDKLVANDCNGNVSRKSKSSMGSEDDAGLGSEKQGFQTGFYPVSPQDQSPKGAGTSRSSVSLPVNRQLNPSAL